jgi:hypothetical protein
LSGVLPGKYGVFVNHESGGDLVSDLAVCEVGEGDVHGIEVRVRQGATISGVVVIEGTTDPAVLAKLKLIQLHAFPRTNPQDQLRTPTQINTKVNADGTFQMRGLAPGKIDLVMTGRPDLNELMRLRVELNGAPVREGIDIAAGEKLTGVRFVLGYGTGAIRGQVKVVGGELPADAGLRVTSRRADAGAANAQFGMFVKSSPIDARGWFLIEHLPPGAYELRLSVFNRTPGDNRMSQLMPLLSRITEQVTVSNGNETPITITVDLSQKERNQ